MHKPFVVLFRSCMPVVIVLVKIKLPVDGTHTHRLPSPLCFDSSLLEEVTMHGGSLQISILKSVWLKLRGWC